MVAHILNYVAYVIGLILNIFAKKNPLNTLRGVPTNFSGKYALWRIREFGEREFGE